MYKRMAKQFVSVLMYGTIIVVFCFVFTLHVSKRVNLSLMSYMEQELSENGRLVKFMFSKG